MRLLDVTQVDRVTIDRPPQGAHDYHVKIERADRWVVFDVSPLELAMLGQAIDETIATDDGVRK